MPRPMPDAPPVTSTTLFLNSSGIDSPGGGCRRADDERGIHDDVSWRTSLVARYALDEQIDGSLAQFLNRLANGRERRMQQACQRYIVDPHDRNVVGDRFPSVADRSGG